MPVAEKFSIHWFDTVDSTNVRLVTDRLVLPGGTVYAAHFQTAGKGQRGNSWKSGKSENLTFSLLLKPTYLSAAQQFAISEAVTLGITDYLAARGVTAKIKWPNDIYVGDRKICGILIENFLGGAKLADSIIGIGLNVNQREFDPSAPNPTSILLETGEMSDPVSELPTLLESIFKWIKVLEKSDFDELEKEYLSRLYRLGEWHDFIDCRGNSDTITPTTVLIDGHRFTGRIAGLAPGGLLAIETTSGEMLTFAFKELRFII